MLLTAAVPWPRHSKLVKRELAPEGLDCRMVFLACALITAVIQVAGWAVAYALQTEKFYDILGGANFLALAAYSAVTADGWLADPRKVAATLIFVCSRSWLLLFLAWRAHERGGD